MSSLFNSIAAASFQEPQSNDATSAPPEPAMPQAAQEQEQPLANPLAKLLAKKKQKQQKQSSVLLAAIRRSRSARPSSERFG